MCVGRYTSVSCAGRPMDFRCCGNDGFEIDGFRIDGSGNDVVPAKAGFHGLPAQSARCKAAEGRNTCRHPSWLAGPGSRVEHQTKPDCASSHQALPAGTATPSHQESAPRPAGGIRPSTVAPHRMQGGASPRSWDPTAAPPVRSCALSGSWSGRSPQVQPTPGIPDRPASRRAIRGRLRSHRSPSASLRGYPSPAPSSP